jgi:hypothetical protein
MTETTRLLLPFTHGVEMDTLEVAVLLAASHHATLVPLSLVLEPRTRGKGARLEHIQQSKDFLEGVHQLRCDGVVLALRGRNGSLLRE